ncbi:5-methylthioadenosine/S-adenosylhomocysteine deaminase [Rhodococcus sp. OAS809]
MGNCFGEKGSSVSAGQDELEVDCETGVEELLIRQASSCGAAAADQRILIKGGSILSMDPQIGDFAVGDILIAGNTIIEVGLSIAAPGAVVIDASNSIVMPGFSDPHIHCWEGALGRLIPVNVSQDSKDPVAAVDGAVASTRSYLYSAHREFGPIVEPEDVYAGTLATLLSALNGGITTVVDNMHNARTPEHADAAVAALSESGARGVLALGAPRAGAWSNTFPDDIYRVRERYFASEDQLCTLRLFAAGADDLTDLVPVRKDLDLWFSFDSGLERQDISALYQRGWLDGREAINHANFLSPEQRQLIVDHGSQVNVCPRIETGFRYGRLPYHEWVDQGLRPGLSNDNPMTYGVDMFTEMRTLHLALRIDEHRGGAKAPSLRAVLESATQAGANNAGLGARTGSLTPGKKADLVLIDASGPQLFPRNNVLCSVVQAADIGSVRAVMVDGRIVKWDGRLVGLNLDRVNHLVEQSRDRLLDKAGWPHDRIDFDD